MLLLDNNLDALPDFLQYGMYITGEFGFGNADGAHALDHNLFSTSLSSSASASQAKTAPFEQTWRPLGRVTLATTQRNDVPATLRSWQGNPSLNCTSGKVMLPTNSAHRRSSAVQPPLLSVGRRKGREMVRERCLRRVALVLLHGRT